MTRLTTTLGAITLALGTLLYAPTTSEACMPGFAHPQKQAMIFWHDGTEILVWRAQVTPAGAPAGGGLGAEPSPSRPARRDLAWVLAVPSAPLAFHVVENEDFDRATAWTMDIRAFSPYGGRGGGIGGSGSGGLAIGETVNVGEYAVTPIEAEGDAGATELNRWLRTNRFPEANGDAVDAYAREGATFLAVKVRLPARFASANLRPLAIAFRSEQIVLPVRLSAGEDPFGMKVTVVSTRVPDYSTALTHGLSAEPVRPHHARGQAPVGLVSIVPFINMPAEMRHLIAPITSTVPGFDRMLTGSVAVSLLGAQPLSVQLGTPDPTIPLGDEVAADAAPSVAHEGHFEQNGMFVRDPSPDATPTAAQSSPEPPSEAPPEATAASAEATNAQAAASANADDDDDGGLCSAAGRPGAGLWLFLGALGVGVGARRRRHRRLRRD